MATNRRERNAGVAFEDDEGCFEEGWIVRLSSEECFDFGGFNNSNSNLSGKFRKSKKSKKSGKKYKDLYVKSERKVRKSSKSVKSGSVNKNIKTNNKKNKYSRRYRKK